MFKTLRNCIFEKKERQLYASIRNDLRIKAVDDGAEIGLIDIGDTMCECIEQLAFARYFSERYAIKVAAYIPGFTSKRRYIYRMLGNLASIISSRGYRLALYSGANRGLDAGIVNSNILKRAKNDSRIFLKEIKTKDDVVNYMISGVQIGVAIYDTYLRENLEATIDIKSSKFEAIALDAFVIFHSVSEYFSYNNIKVVVLGHCVYNNWKILSDYAIQRGIQVYVTYNSRAIPIHDVSANRGLQTTDHSNYKADFEKLDKQQKVENIKIGCEMMARRLNGEVDLGIAYMNSSPYAMKNDNEKIIVPSGKKPIVMMLHSFFDSPHVYKNMIYADFLEWVQQTLEIFSTSDMLERYQIYIKPHPNRFPTEDELISKILSKYIFAKYLSSEISNITIVEMQPACILTVYGSVAAEFSYARVPVITCGDNPTSSFSFTYEAHSREQYIQLLQDADKLKINSDQIEEIGQFMFMHYINIKLAPAATYPFERYTVHSGKSSFERLGNFEYKEFRKIVNEKMDDIEIPSRLLGNFQSSR